MRALHYERRPKARRMPRPAVARGQPLGLSFFLEYAIQHPFASLHVTGVTFYAGGSQSYVSGYGLLPMGEHDIEANKDYVRDLLRQHENITIDYPIDDTTDPQAAKDAAELATVVTQPQYELDGLGEWVSADGREAAPKPFSSTSSSSVPVHLAQGRKSRRERSSIKIYHLPLPLLRWCGLLFPLPFCAALQSFQGMNFLPLLPWSGRPSSV